MQQAPGRDYMMLGTTDDLGKRRLQGIHNRVAYMVDKFLYEEYKDYSPNPWQLCERCELKKDISWSKSCAENKHYFLKCNKLAWLCEAVEESTNIPEVSWDRQNLMTRNVYMKIIEDIINEMEPRQVMLCVWKLNRDLTVLQPHMNRTCTLVEQNLMNRYIPWGMCNASFPLPPLGKELDDEYVPPLNPTMNQNSPVSDCLRKKRR